jgi:hypothetical protein
MKKVVSYANLPTKLPTVSTVAFGLLLDRLQAPGWVWGIYICLFSILWLGSLWLIIIEEKHEDIF